jgi:hypothetical protein
MKTAAVLFVICLILIHGCVFLPETKVDSLVLENCQTYTNKWELTHKQYVDFNSCAGSPVETGICLGFVGIVVPAGSFILSGSVVLVGNTLHWLEYKGRCEDDDIDGDLIKMSEVTDNKATK